MQKLPSKIGKYKILSMIGEGGMGSVYKAQHPTLDRFVVLKRLSAPSNDSFIERFRREAKIMMDFRNENIVQVYDHFKAGETYFIVMEYVDGISLEQLIRERRYLSSRDALLIFHEVALALQYAHEKQILHRDIKPANILISTAGVVKLVDFGVAAQMGENDENSITETGITIGTPAYIAPEQISNAAEKDHRSDIYSMGVLLYEMLLGKKPYTGGFTPEIIGMIQQGKYILPKKINPKISGSIQNIVKKAMHHKVNRRFQDMSLLLRKLSPYVKGYRNKGSLQSAIQRVLENRQDEEGVQEAQFSMIKGLGWLFIISVILTGLGGTGYWAYLQGYQYEYIQSDQYGALTVNVKLRKGYKEKDENFLQAVLYRDQNNKLVRNSEVLFLFNEIESKIKSEFIELSSQKVYLKSGSYMILLYAENEQHRSNFYLPPIDYQKKENLSSNSKQITFQSKKQPPRLPVTLEVNFTDIVTGEEIVPPPQIEMNYNQKWTLWEKLNFDSTNKNEFHSGKRYLFRFTREGYIKKSYPVTIRPEQTLVALNLKMIPKPGTLSIRADQSGLTFSINHRDSYLEGGKNSSYKKIPSITAKVQQLSLAPGEYFLTAKKSGLFSKTLRISQKFNIDSEEKTKRFITLNKKTGNLQFITE